MRQDNFSREAPQLSEIPDSAVPWVWDKEAFWNRPIQTGAEVDAVATHKLQLEQWDVPIEARGGHGDPRATIFGMPYQLAEDKLTTRVWDKRRTLTTSEWLRALFGQFDASKKLTEMVAYPRGFVRIQNDPFPGDTDRHSILVDPHRGVLVEGISVGPSLGIHNSTVAGNFTFWDTKRSWQETKGGVIAARVPLFPLIPRREEIERGRIDHMMALVMDRYNSRYAFRTPARGTDGRSSNHPVLSGARLRLKQSSLMRLLEDYGDNPVAVAVIHASSEYGLIVMDKSTENGDNDNSGKAHITMPQDVWFKPFGFQLRLSDLEVVNW